MNNSVLALVDGELWPLHQPLTRSCSLTLLTFKDNDPTMVNQVRPGGSSLNGGNYMYIWMNIHETRASPSLLSDQAYWRSCGALLGQVLETAFKDDFAVELLSTPEVPGTGSAD